ncbi:hypothetical protein [Pseudarthrobacter sp. NBSH8]|uniref:hypothetical protein n=1 Tax=Pseudarthrobacter sp. NBSH8 TaxID=2596911 RepID=UPI00162756F6|nr:hypothetical protein [Pseudarthrobacter sp. NBSH8]QNE14585.1 hypothetical protein FYJ92_09245 [Pseudarthrobacter sp. NBSH8]
MNSTNRGLNRFLLAILGIVVLAAGVLTGWAGAAPELARQWTRIGQHTLAWTRQQLRAAPIPGTDTSWWTAASLLAVVLALVLLVFWIRSQGGGHIRRIGNHEDAGRGATAVDVSYAAEAITDATAGNDQILSTTVTAWRLKGADALKINVQARRGASPADIESAMEVVIAGLDTILGEQVPVLVHIGSGPRSRFAGPELVH